MLVAGLIPARCLLRIAVCRSLPLVCSVDEFQAPLDPVQSRFYSCQIGVIMFLQCDDCCHLEAHGVASHRTKLLEHQIFDFVMHLSPITQSIPRTFSPRSAAPTPAPGTIGLDSGQDYEAEHESELQSTQ